MFDAQKLQPHFVGRTHFSSAGLRFLPTCQFRNFAHKNSGDKAGHSELDNLFAHPCLHFSHGNIRQHKLSVLITMTAVHRVARPVSVSATAVFIPFQRHPATLAVLVRLIHNVEELLNQFKQKKQSMTNESHHDGRTDFDFLIGSWNIQHRRLKERLKGCTEWEEFEGTGKVRHILGGLGNMDELTMNRGSGRVQAVTVRLYNPVSAEWSIYWATDSNPGRLDVPMVGKFDGGRGEFFSQERFEGRHIFSRFIWTVNGPDACHWEQAFSADGGKSWETNWTMTFTRQR
jgi:hypothetical protein